MITISIGTIIITVGGLAGICFFAGVVMILNQGRYSNRDNSSQYMSEASRRYSKQGHGK